jgi:hypothetical protein
VTLHNVSTAQRPVKSTTDILPCQAPYIMVDTFLIMKLNSDDITRLIRACRMYQDHTGSEFLWDEYEHLVHKLEYYEEEHCPDEW